MASGSTPRLDIPYPLSTDAANFSTDIAAIATFVDTNMIPYTQASTAPLTPIAGSLWWCTNASSTSYGLNYYDGSSWHNVATDTIYFGNSAPSVVYPGLTWFNTTNPSGGLSIYNGSTWVSILPTTATNGLAMISSAGGWVAAVPTDTTKVAKSGDTMTGPLILSGGPTTGLGAATKTYVDTETSRAEAAEALLIPKSNNNPVFTAPLETSYINATAPNGTQNIYVTTNGTSILCTSNATGNFSFNVASTSGASLNSLMAVGQEITVAIKVKQGSTPYYCTAISIDGTGQTVNWQGGAAPTYGYASGYDVYVINITKTASSTYVVLASMNQF